MWPYPSIARLEELHGSIKPEVVPLDGEFLEQEYYPLVEFRLKGKSYKIYLDNEYEDLELGNPLLNLCLVLRALENYLDTEDYLVWCTQHGIDPANSVARNYHMGLGKAVREIALWIDPIDSFISDYDFELNAGAAQFLRKHPYNTNA